MRNFGWGAFFLLFGLAAQARAADAGLAARWVAYGQKQYAARDYNGAIQSFGNAARANSGDAAAWRGLGNAYYSKRDYPTALKYYRYSLQLSPNDAALAQFVQKLAASTAPGGPAASQNMAAAGRYYQARDYDHAIQYYNAALAENPNNAGAYQGLGNCYYAKSDKERAVQAYQRALGLNPGNSSLRAFLDKYAPAAPAAAGPAVAEGPKDWAQPLWRSALLPGWGQVYNGQKSHGYLVGGVTLGLLAGTVTTYVIGDNARQTYLGLSDPKADFDTPYSTWETMANMNHIFAIAFATAYGFNLVDAILTAKPAPGLVGWMPQEGPIQISLRPGGVALETKLLEF